MSWWRSLLLVMGKGSSFEGFSLVETVGFFGSLDKVLDLNMI